MHSIVTSVILLTGHQRIVRETGCLPQVVRLNACYGYCNSFTVPTYGVMRKAFPEFPMFTRARCCSIVESHDVSNIELFCNKILSIYVRNIELYLILSIYVRNIELFCNLMLSIYVRNIELYLILSIYVKKQSYSVI